MGLKKGCGNNSKNTDRYSCTWVRFLFMAVLATLTFAASAQQAGPYPDGRYFRSVPAGPCTEVETGTGELRTSVPILHLKGLGNTSVDVDLTFRSNRMSGTTWGAANNSPGAGWFLGAAHGMSQNGTGFQEWFGSGGGDVVNSWTGVDSNGQYTETAGPGTRFTLSVVTSLGNPTELIETDESNLNQYIYSFNPSKTGYADVLWLSQVKDVWGNTVNYS